MDFAYLCKCCNEQFDILQEFENHAQKHRAEGLVVEAKIVCLQCRRDYDGMKGFRGKAEKRQH